jgi:hypothetical protein
MVSRFLWWRPSDWLLQVRGFAHTWRIPAGLGFLAVAYAGAAPSPRRVRTIVRAGPCLLAAVTKKPMKALRLLRAPVLTYTGRRRWRLFGPRRRVQARCRIRTPSIVGSPNAASGFERSGFHYDERRTVGVKSRLNNGFQPLRKFTDA